MPCPTLIVSGNPRPNSTTLDVATRATRALGEAAGVDLDISVLELSDITDTLLTWQHPDAESARRRVADAQLVVVATPSYKGTYTGLLKAFLDGYGPASLAGTIAVPVAVAGSPVHAYSTPLHTSTLLGEVGALTPFAGLGVMESVARDESALDGAIDAWVSRHEPILPVVSAAASA
ncbi:NADPH-dependent FMN reductase [Demequina flava]|uniref:NADPH-dependent FMN reductase n=1 Tax=Demequina flava TaxID=1095025 RepID=UPI0007863BEF|nr:NAD(P)H-dependent oxidoreductase [Demequina flava]